MGRYGEIWGDLRRDPAGYGGVVEDAHSVEEELVAREGADVRVVKGLRSRRRRRGRHRDARGRYPWYGERHVAALRRHERSRLDDEDLVRVRVRVGLGLVDRDLDELDAHHRLARLLLRVRVMVMVAVGMRLE